MNQTRKSPFPPKFDASSRPGATIIAEHIAAVWARRGYRNVTAKRVQLWDEGPWGVSSNLVDGLPPRTRR
jgi:hypothetical protein